MSVSMAMPGNRRASNTPMRAHTRRMRLTLKGKILLVTLVMALSWGGISALTDRPAHSEIGATAVTSYTVRPGDTLWSYAASITPQGQDIQQTVSDLIALNDLDSSALEAGQRIIVPLR